MNRVQRQRKKGYKTPENTKYVGRPTKFGNPFRLTKDGYIQVYSKNIKFFDKWIMWSISGGFEQKDIVELYEIWIKGNLQKKHPYLPTPPQLDELKGKNLSCFCSLNIPCHVDILLQQLSNN
jgi:hypothetical protein